MALRAYRDEDVELEVGGQYGTYLRSFADQQRLVEVHFFRDASGETNIYITKASGVPVVTAQQVAQLALAVFRANETTPPGIIRSHLPVSGSVR